MREAVDETRLIGFSFYLYVPKVEHWTSGKVNVEFSTRLFVEVESCYLKTEYEFTS